MIPFDVLCAAWRNDRARRLARFAKRPSFTPEGLTLGPMVVLTKSAFDDRNVPTLVINGNEARILALLAVAYWRPVGSQVIDALRRAAKALAGNNPALSSILIAQAGLGPLDTDERTAFRLFAAERLLDEGVTPHALLNGLGLTAWSLDAFAKYSPDEPRIPAGQAGGGQWVSESEGNATNVGKNIDACIDECHTLLGRPLPYSWSDLNKVAFWKCLNDCMQRGK